MKHQPLGEIAASELEAARQADVLVTLSFEGRQYQRYRDDSAGVPRGTLLVGDRVVPAYPSIGRICALEAGLERNFPGPFSLEEKINGYNVRLVWLDGVVLPVTRGGYACPFTADRLSDMGDFEPLLRAHPDLVMCGEVAGPENPYILGPCPRVERDVGFFAFDLVRCNRNGFVPLDERDALLGEFGIPTARVFGRYSTADLPAIREILLELDREGAEGLVFKPVDRDGLSVKYVGPRTNLEDIVVEAPLLAEVPPAFFELRLVRLAIGIAELGAHALLPELERRLGHALMTGLLDTIEGLRDGGVVSERYRVRLTSDEAADRLMGHLNRASHAIHVREVERRLEGAYIRLVFDKIHHGSTSRLKTLLDGNYLIE